MKRRIHILHGHPAYWCPVCKWPHHLDGRWKWNGDFDKPTFSAAAPGQRFSYLSYVPAHKYKAWHLVKPGKLGDIGYATKERAEEVAREAALGPEWVAKEIVRDLPQRTICHVYVRDGNIQILPDSKALGGQTLPLEEWDDEKWR